MTEQEIIASLDKPGAGVPFPQRIAMRFLLKPLYAHRTPYEESRDRFARLHAKVEKLISGLSEEQLSKRVLVPPMTGLEDSSRYWSIAMTLDHVVIVGRHVLGLIGELDQGRVPPVEATTATVKPSVRPVADVLKDYRQYAGVDVPALLPRLKNLDSRMVYRHPWFGNMRMQGWYWLQPTHLRLHVAQIAEIRKGL